MAGRDMSQKRKKERKSRVLVPEEEGRLLGRRSYCGQMAEIMRVTHCPPVEG